MDKDTEECLQAFEQIRRVPNYPIIRIKCGYAITAHLTVAGEHHPRQKHVEQFRQQFAPGLQIKLYPSAIDQKLSDPEYLFDDEKMKMSGLRDHHFFAFLYGYPRFAVSTVRLIGVYNATTGEFLQRARYSDCGTPPAISPWLTKHTGSSVNYREIENSEIDKYDQAWKRSFEHWRTIIDANMLRGANSQPDSPYA